MGGGFLLLYPSWIVYFVDGRELARLSDFLSTSCAGGTFQMYCGRGDLGLAYSLECTAVWLCKPG